jgi:hypothetical protein
VFISLFHQIVYLFIYFCVCLFVCLPINLIPFSPPFSTHDTAQYDTFKFSYRFAKCSLSYVMSRPLNIDWQLGIEMKRNGMIWDV